MFGFGFSEFVLVLIVGIVVVGPRNLPTLMRTAGRWVAKLRRLSTDLRAQSGIDDLIRQEGLEREIQELRALSRVNVLESLVAPGLAAATAPRPRPVPQSATPALPADSGDEPLREREYPDVGCDAYDCLPDDVVPYPEAPAPADAKPTADAAAVDAPVADAPVADAKATDAQTAGEPVADANAPDDDAGPADAAKVAQGEPPAAADAEAKA